MNAMIFNPVQDFDTKFRHLHLEQTKTYLNALIQRSAVNVEQNRKTVKDYNDCNKDIYAWPTKMIVAAKNGYTTRIPFIPSKEIKQQARGVFF